MHDRRFVDTGVVHGFEQGLIGGRRSLDQWIASANAPTITLGIGKTMCGWISMTACALTRVHILQNISRVDIGKH